MDYACSRTAAVARHEIAATGSGSRVTLAVEFYGWLGEWIGRRTAAQTERYLRMEAEGLKRRCENSAKS